MQVSTEILNILGQAIIEDNKLYLQGDLDRNTYVKVNKVIESAGGKWNRSAKAHIFDAGTESRIEQILNTGSVDVPKDEFNYFPTPTVIVEQMLSKVDVSGKTVLEPSAGQGNIALKAKELGANVQCIELMDANYDVLTKHFDNVIKMDFLEYTDSKFDVILMNPPFFKQNDIKHVTHAIDLLNDGGTLVAIMSASCTFRTDKRTTEFKQLIESMNGVIEVLPEGSFKQSKTMVNTVMVTVTKNV